MRRRWAAWRRRQPSRVRFAVVPGGSRIVAAGLRSEVRLVELRVPAMFVVAVVAVAALAGCGSTRTVTTSATQMVPVCAGAAGISRCAADIARLKLRLGGLPATGVRAKCSLQGAWWVCGAVVEDEQGSEMCVRMFVRTTPREHVPYFVSWNLDSTGLCGIT